MKKAWEFLIYHTWGRLGRFLDFHSRRVAREALQEAQQSTETGEVAQNTPEPGPGIAGLPVRPRRRR